MRSCDNVCLHLSGENRFYFHLSATFIHLSSSCLLPSFFYCVYLLLWLQLSNNLFTHKGIYWTHFLHYVWMVTLNSNTYCCPNFLSHLTSLICSHCWLCRTGIRLSVDLKEGKSGPSPTTQLIILVFCSINYLVMVIFLTLLSFPHRASQITLCLTCQEVQFVSSLFSCHDSLFIISHINSSCFLLRSGGTSVVMQCSVPTSRGPSPSLSPSLCPSPRRDIDEVSAPVKRGPLLGADHRWDESQCSVINGQRSVMKSQRSMVFLSATELQLLQLQVETVISYRLLLNLIIDAQSSQKLLGFIAFH